MHILEVNTERTWRGGERQTWYNIKGFKEREIAVSLLCKKSFPLEQKTQELNVPVYTVKGSWGLFFFLCAKGRAFDVIHVQTSKTLTYALLSKLFHGRPVVYTRRVDFVPHGFFTKLKYRWADRIVAISTPIKQILQVTGAKNIPVITEIVEEKKLDADRARNFIRERGWEGKKIIATTSAIVQHKDPLTMARTIATLTEIRKDFVFLHFGSGALQSSLEQEIDRLKIQNYYKLPGFIDNVEDFFSIMDVFAMSSEEEGLGSSVLDAFIYKVPVASTNAGGLREILDGRGLLCSVKDEKALAANIHRLLETPALRQELTDKASCYAREHNSPGAVTTHYLQLFNALLQH